MKTVFELIIVFSLDNLEEGTIFNAKEWPLHVTVVPPFTAALDLKSFLFELGQVALEQQPVNVELGNRAMFGPNSDTPVFAAKDNPRLNELHNLLVNLLRDKYGATFRSPDYIGIGYQPHITVQENPRFETGQEILLRNLAVIDMNTGDDPSKCKVVWSVGISS